MPETPLNDKAKADLIELIDAPPDYLPGKTREEKFEILSQTTYADFLTEICGYDPQLVDYFQHSTEAYFGVGIDGDHGARCLGQLAIRASTAWTSATRPTRR